MPNPIKAFFEKKKAEAKFKLAGPGQRLGDTAAAEQQARARQEQAARAAGGSRSGGSRQPQGAAAATAAQAALARLDVNKGEDFEKKRSQAVIRAQAKKELEREKQVLKNIHCYNNFLAKFNVLCL